LFASRATPWHHNHRRIHRLVQSPPLCRIWSLGQFTPTPHSASLLQGVPQKCVVAYLYLRHFWGACLGVPKSIHGEVGSVSPRFSSSSSPFLAVVVPANPPRIKT